MKLMIVEDDKALAKGIELALSEKENEITVCHDLKTAEEMWESENADLVILDEPINGLDPIGISELRDTFRKLNQERGITLIISSHILSELYAVANRFLFIDNGRVIKEITKQELDLECSRCITVKTDNVKKTAIVLESNLNITNYQVIDTKEIRIYDENAKSNELNKAFIQNGVNISQIYESGVSLEDYFKQLVREVQS